jgi:CHAD domain-containing protein
MKNHNTEIELKFLVSRHLPFKQVRTEFVEQVSAFGFVVTRSSRQKLTDVYFDSLSSHLERAGWTLRCRYTDTDNVCLTLKSIAGANATFCRTEHEEVLPRDDINFDEHLVIPSNSKIVQFLRENDLPAQALLPVFKQTNKRTNYTITHPAERNTEIQWSVDKVRPENSQGLHTLERYIEFELELLRGSEQLLQHLTLIAQRCDGLSAARMGKFIRARYAHNPRSSDLEASLQTPPNSQDPFNFKTRLRHLIQYEPFAYEALHPEGVHQLRVSTRKLRASLSLLHEQVPAALATRLESELKTLTSRLGKVRDLDVHRDQLGVLLQRDEWQNYLEHLNASTHKQQLRMRKTLDSSFTNIVSELDIFNISDFTNTPAAHFAAETGAEIIRHIYTTIQGINANTDAKRLHKLRIELKKLRYKLATYADEEEQAAQWLKHIKGLLTLLGDFQDTEMARLKISKYLRNKPRSEKRHFKCFLHSQQQLAATHRAALATACSNLAELETTTR